MARKPIPESDIIEFEDPNLKQGFAQVPRPVLKARADCGDTLELHWRLAYQAAARRRSARRQCRFLEIGHDAPLL